VEAEPLFLKGYVGMEQREAKIPRGGKIRLTEALEKLVELYDAWGKKEKASQWRGRLDEAKSNQGTQAKTEKRCRPGP
jgi:hypothetical protein